MICGGTAWTTVTITAKSSRWTWYHMPFATADVVQTNTRANQQPRQLPVWVLIAQMMFCDCSKQASVSGNRPCIGYNL
jgi:hypothetical protein